MELKVDLRKEEDILFVKLYGDLDINSVNIFKDKINSVEEIRKIIIDCEELSYVDSTGLGAFISVYKN